MSNIRSNTPYVEQFIEAEAAVSYLVDEVARGVADFIREYDEVNLKYTPLEFVVQELDEYYSDIVDWRDEF